MVSFACLGSFVRVASFTAGVFWFLGAVLLLVMWVLCARGFSFLLVFWVRLGMASVEEEADGGGPNQGSRSYAMVAGGGRACDDDIAFREPCMKFRRPAIII